MLTAQHQQSIPIYIWPSLLIRPQYSTCLKRDVLFLLLSLQQLNPSSTCSQTISDGCRQTQDTDEWTTRSLKDRNIDRSYAVPFSFEAPYTQIEDKSEPFTSTTDANNKFMHLNMSVCIFDQPKNKKAASTKLKTRRSFPCLPRRHPLKADKSIHPLGVPNAILLQTAPRAHT